MSVSAWIVALALAVPVAPPPASAPDTLKAVTTRGMTVTTPDVVMVVTFEPNGLYSAMDGRIVGSWRIDGDRLCTTSNIEPAESCAAYPKGLGPGDEFEADLPSGKHKFRIH